MNYLICVLQVVDIEMAFIIASKYDMINKLITSKYETIYMAKSKLARL